MTIREAVKNLYQARDAIDALLEAYEKKEQGSTQRTAKKAVTRFVAPSLKEWIEYAKSLAPPYAETDAEGAWNYYESVGWKVGGKAPMKNWKASCRQCHQRWKRETAGVAQQTVSSPKKGTMWELKTQLDGVNERLAYLNSKCPGPHASLADHLTEKEKDEWSDLMALKRKLEEKIRKFDEGV